MFTKFRVRNFRTHVDTEINLKDLTLLIGSNNSGKTNLLEALAFFAELVRKGAIASRDLFFADDNFLELFLDNLHALHEEKGDFTMFFSCEWEKGDDKIFYSLTLTPLAYVETMKANLFQKNIELTSSITKGNNTLSLQQIAQQTEKSAIIYNKIKSFFERIASFAYYHFQPALIKKQAAPIIYDFTGDKWSKIPEINFFEKAKEGQKIDVAQSIGKEGANFQDLVTFLETQELDVHLKFLSFLRKFEKNSGFVQFDMVHGMELQWVFDVSGKLVDFPTHKVSDGFLKAAAIALVCSMEQPPAIVMIEEVENGINQRNLSEFLGWLAMVAQSSGTQFILTTHSPSVIREFHTRLNQVYSVHLKKQKGYRSDVTNLQDALMPLVRIGSIDEDAVSEVDGNLHIKPYVLTELFYDGTLRSI